MLASFSMWAADPTLPADATPSTTYDAKVKDAELYAITNAVKDGKQYFVYDLDTIRTQMKANKVTWIKGPKNDGGNSAGTISLADGLTDAEKYGFNTSWNRAWGIHNGRYAGIRVKNCCEFAALTKSNSTKDNKTLYIQVFKKNADAWDFVETLGEGKYNSNYYVLTATLNADEEYVILLTSGNSSNCLTAQVRFASPYCTDPEATIADDASIFVGDAKDLAFSSSNTNDVAFAVTLDGEAADAEDYTIADGKFTANVAGEFVITATQEADETYCAVEESVTLTVSAKSPVNTIEVQGPSSARIGQEVTLSVVTDNAADTIYWTLMGAVVENEHSATLTFTPETAGTYTYAAWARNQFNEAGAWKVDDIDVTVAVGTDATLSDLKVNGTTVEGFDPAVLAYAIGEIGIYEALAVTATAADAPYATTAVVDDKAGTVTITVTAEDESTKEYTITYTRAAATELVAISESTTWDWTKAGGKAPEFTDATTPTRNEWFNFADVLPSPDASFKAESLEGMLQFANRDNNSYAQGHKLRFETTVPGNVSVVFSNTGTKDVARNVYINGVDTEAGAKKTDKVTTPEIAVPAGIVLIEGIEMLETPAANMLRFYKVTFTKTDIPAALDNTDAAVKTVKVIRDGQLIILRDGKEFNVLGAIVK